MAVLLARLRMPLIYLGMAAIAVFRLVRDKADSLLIFFGLIGRSHV